MKTSHKITIIGREGTGRHTIANQYLTNSIHNYYDNLGVQIYTGKLTENMTIQVWMPKIEYPGFIEKIQGSHAIIYVFDKTRINTLESLNKIITKINQENTNSLKIMIGTKEDENNNIIIKEFMKEHKEIKKYYDKKQIIELIQDLKNYLIKTS